MRPLRSVASKRWDVFRWVLLIGWISVVVAIPLASTRTSSWGELVDRVESGKVTEVHLSSDLPVGRDDEVTVHVQWEDGYWRHVTEVTQIGADRRTGFVDNDRSTATLTSTPASELRLLQPDLVVSELDVPDHELARFAGFEFTWALTIAAAVLTIAGFILLVFGPVPWRATKWAWFWLMGLPPFLALFVLLSGPVPGLPPPRRPLRRLTGGWAFLIAVVLFGGTTSFVWR